MSTIKTAARSVHGFALRLLLDPVLRHERRRGRPPLNDRPVEYAFVLRQVARLYPRRMLDVGSGKTALPHLLWTCGCDVTAVELERSFNRHFQVVQDDITQTRLAGAFDLVTCISVLEHIPDYDTAVRAMVRLLAPGGTLILTFPYNERSFVPRLADVPGFTASYGQCTRVFSRTAIDGWLSAFDLEIDVQEYCRLYTGPYYGMGTLLAPPAMVDRQEDHHLSCLALRKRA